MVVFSRGIVLEIMVTLDYLLFEYLDLIGGLR